MRLVSRPALSSAALVLLLIAAPHANGRRPISDVDLLDFVWVADPQISPDGQQVAFVRVTADVAHDTYASSIWTVPADGSASPRPMTAEGRDTMPRWSPDGRRLSFLRAPGTEDGVGPAQVFALDLSGGEPAPLTALPEGVSGYAWRPDGAQLAVVSRVRGAAATATERRRPKASDVRVITRATFRGDGTGYIDAGRRSRVFLVTVDPDATRPAPFRPVGSSRIDDRDPVWAPDGAHLYFVSETSVEPDYDAPRTVLTEADADGQHVRQVAAIAGEMSRPAPSPDGSRIALYATLAGQPIRSYSQPDLFVIDVRTGEARNLTEHYDYDMGAGLGGDQRAPRGSSSTRPVWTSAQSVLAVATREGEANLVSVDVAGGTVTPATTGAQDVQGFTTSDKARRLALLISTPTRIGDLFVSDADATLAPASVTDVNGPLFSQLDLPVPESFWYRSFDGTRVQGWILKPAGFTAGTRYPMVLQIHGGPHAAYGATFTHEFLWLAAKGYAVVYTNPRGSTSYGQQFGNVIQFRYPGDDYKDLMRGVDEVLARGYVDPRRLGVTGGSGGGLLTNWAITQTTRFRAAVSQRSIADWTAWWYAADFTLFRPQWFHGGPWQDAEDFAARSPVRYADRIETPLMLIDGDVDYRTPPSAGGEAMFRALKMLRKPVVMVRVPDEGHELSRSGRPWHRIDRLRHIAGWFDKWLLGVPKPEYD